MNENRTPNEKAPQQPVNWPLIVCHFAGLPLELVFHDVRTFGVRAVGPKLGGALLLMFLFAASHSHESGMPLGIFMLAVLLLGITAQIITWVRQWGGEKTHSRYTGRPYAAWLWPRSEVTIKRLEPVAALLAGFGIHHLNRGLGAFVMTAAVGLGITVSIQYRSIWTRALDMNDAIIEQSMSAERVRVMQRR